MVLTTFDRLRGTPSAHDLADSRSLFSSASAEPVAVASFGLLGLTLAVARSGPGSSRGPVLATVELELAHVLAVALEDAHAA